MFCDTLVELSGVKHDAGVNQAHWVFVKQTGGLWFWFMGQVVLMCSGSLLKSKVSLMT